MSRPSTIRVGIVLPHSHYGEEEWQNAERAIAYADEAAGQGAQLVLYPEGYPGPMTGPLDNPRFPFDPVEELKKKAKQHAIYIIAGNVVASEVPGGHLLTLRLLGPEGTELACYLRQQPDTPPLNAYLYGGKGHLLPGRSRMVVDTDLGKIGLLILWIGCAICARGTSMRRISRCPRTRTGVPSAAGHGRSTSAIRRFTGSSRNRARIHTTTATGRKATSTAGCGNTTASTKVTISAS